MKYTARLILFWLVAVSQNRILVPCGDWKVINSTVSIVSACLEETDKVVWKKSFKNRNDAEKYEVYQVPGLIYSVLESN